jgi:hypothetical protein
MISAMYNRVIENTQDYWVFGLCSSFGILKDMKEHNVSERDPISEKLCSL